MKEFYDIIMALIDNMHWFVILYITYKVYSNKPKHTFINFNDIIKIESDR